MLLSPTGKPVSERERVETPAIPTPTLVMRRLDELHKRLSHCNRVSVGFPGVVFAGVIKTAPNLGPGWAGVRLASRLDFKNQDRIGRFYRLGNIANF